MSAQTTVHAGSPITLEHLERLRRGELGEWSLGDFDDVLEGILKAYERGRSVVVRATDKTLVHGTEFLAMVSGQGGCVEFDVDPEKWLATDCPIVVEAARRIYRERNLSMQVLARRTIRARRTKICTCHPCPGDRCPPRLSRQQLEILRNCCDEWFAVQRRRPHHAMKTDR